MRWIVGDVHGMRLSLESLLEAIAARDPSPRLVFTGDYVNRGPDSRGVIDLLMKRTDATFVRGNHDDILDIILHGAGYCDHPATIEPVAAFLWFMQHGLSETLVSYGADVADVEYAAANPSPERVREAVSVIPEDHRRFIHTLRPLHEEPDLFVAHAMWDVNTPDADMPSRLGQSGPDRYKILWGRYSEKEISRKKRWQRTGYFGHTPVQTYGKDKHAPLRGPDIVLMDTGAVLGPTGRLSAVCAETGVCVQVGRSGEQVEAA